MQFDDFRFSYPLRVRWAEVDMQSVVFNGNYLTYADVGITEYLRELKLRGGDFSAVRAVLEYKGAARFDDLLDISVRVSRLGRSSMLFLIGMWRDGTLLTSGEITYVNTDLETRTAKPLPEHLRSTIMAYEKVAPLS
jgi:acyl-CoA thioester hydrolase